jgi:hypothetical protein
MPNAMIDRRVAPRYPLILLAEVTDLLSSTKFTARTSDLSRTGCYIDMLHPLPGGQNCTCGCKMRRKHSNRGRG